MQIDVKSRELEQILRDLLVPIRRDALAGPHPTDADLIELASIDWTAPGDESQQALRRRLLFDDDAFGAFCELLALITPTARPSELVYPSTGGSAAFDSDA